MAIIKLFNIADSKNIQKIAYR